MSDAAFQSLVGVVGVAFAAFVVWLTVRIVNRRERWAKRMLAIAAALSALYALSFGPVCWISSRTESRSLPAVYLPIGWLLNNSPHPIATVIVRYARAGMLSGSSVSVPVPDRDVLPFLILD
jgi:hypothetical protein